MILEYLNIALFCLGFFILTVVFSIYRSSKNIIFDNKKVNNSSQKSSRFNIWLNIKLPIYSHIFPIMEFNNYKIYVFIYLREQIGQKRESICAC